MLVFLVFLIVLILLFGSSAVLSTILGAVGWIVGAVAFLGFSVWFATTYHVDVGIVMCALIFGVPTALFFVIYVLHHIENRNLPPEQRRSFADTWKAAGGKKD